MALALYRKYRSRSLEEVVGQEHVTNLLRRAIDTGRIGHAYLFTGPRGVGKTSIARILAYEINKIPYQDGASHLDIIEIDAASNNGVEDIRDLRDKVQIAPVSASKKIYIIDEVHMLSKPAFNALLKTLEEPPSHAIFILATTDIDKVPDTILSRAQRFTFRRASIPAIIQNLHRITAAENISVSDEALNIIAEHSDGSFRDSVSLLDQLISAADSTGSISQEAILSALGLAPIEAIRELLSRTSAADIPGIEAALTELEQQGVPSRAIAAQLMSQIRRSIAASPELLPLLDQLLDVSKSSQSNMKLLTTLCLAFTDEPAARTLPQIKEQARVSYSRATPAKLPKKTRKVSQSGDSPLTEPTKSPSSVAQEASRPKLDVPAADFNWNTFVEYVRSNYVAINSVLSKCQPVVEGSVLTLYTRSPFYKKKLDDAKYLSLLHTSLDALGYTGIEIVTIPTTLPPVDSQAARVAAIMGGGEEIALEETA